MKKFRVQNNFNFDSFPFERYAFEAVLTSLKSLQSQEINENSQKLEELLLYLKNSTLVPFTILEKLRLTKNRLFSVGAHVQDSIRTLELLADDEESMAVMNLSYLHYHPYAYRYGPWCCCFCCLCVSGSL